MRPDVETVLGALTFAGLFAAFTAFLWAVVPYFATAAGPPGFLTIPLYIYGVVPWIVARPLRLLAAIPFTLCFVLVLVESVRR